MARPTTENLETFLRRQSTDDLVAVLLELAHVHATVQERLVRMQLVDRPDDLAAGFKKTLAAWKRSTRFHGYREAREFGSTLESWLDQVARELLPRDPPAAVELFEAFIEADTTWFERADDSDGVIGDAVRSACRYWLQAAARCETPAQDWAGRLARLHEADQYGAREALLRHAHLLLDEPAQRGLAARYEAQLTRALATSPREEGAPPIEVFRRSAALSLLSESLGDPDVTVRATLLYSPQPNPLQMEVFARAYLDADRPADALVWLNRDWEHMEARRQELLAKALERLGRFDESVSIRQQSFERTLSVHDLQCWLEHLSEAARADALARARQLALEHGEPTAAAMLLIELGDPVAAEARLLAEPGRVGGSRYGSLVPLAKALRARDCLRGETLVYRALLKDILDRAYTRAYGHAARYWARLREIAGGGTGLLPLASHEAFEAGIRARHGRKASFWAYVNGTRRDRHEGDDEDPDS